MNMTPLERLPEIIRQLPDTIKRVPHLWRTATVIGTLVQKVFGYSSGVYLWISPHTYLFSAVQMPMAGYYSHQSFKKIEPLQSKLNMLLLFSTQLGHLGICGNHGLRFFQGLSGGSKIFSASALLFESMSVTGRLTAHTIEWHRAENVNQVTRTRLEIAAILLDLVSKGIFTLTPYTLPGTAVLVISTLVSFSKYLYTQPSND